MEKANVTPDDFVGKDGDIVYSPAHIVNVDINSPF